MTLIAGGEEHRIEPGVFARVGPNEKRKLTTGEQGALVLVLGGVPGAIVLAEAVHRGGRAGPARAREATVADVTVKRIEDFEAIFRGGFRRVRAGSG